MEMYCSIKKIKKACYPQNKVCYSDSAGRVGFRHNGQVEWWAWTRYQNKCGYMKSGSTKNIGRNYSKHKV